MPSSFFRPLPLRLSPLRLLPVAALLAASTMPLTAQSSTSQPPAASSTLSLSPVQDAETKHRWNWGAFFNGGTSARNTPSYRFLSVGVRAGKILTDPAGPGFLRGQFEYSAELMPWWQGYTSPYQRYNLTATSNPGIVAIAGPYRTGGSYNGVSVTPIILRWDLAGTRRIMPFVQGAGGLIWTDHKFPPVGPFPLPGHQGTSVWNFTPQFGIGLQYFLKPRRSITFNANAVHISNASLGDANPGVNATVQFQIGYSWWK
ncbi:MAG: acyloxyacyl hydrolase [Acidobacteriaceae bacterium]|nr:acyloxyacyl hydrolase [Acidobacteriaceae bacterium]